MQSSESSGGNLRLSVTCSAPFSELWSLSNQSLLGSRSRHCYAIKCSFGGDFNGCAHASAIRPRWTLHDALSHQFPINQESHLRFAIIIFSEDVPSHEVSYQLIS